MVEQANPLFRDFHSCDKRSDPIQHYQCNSGQPMEQTAPAQRTQKKKKPNATNKQMHQPKNATNKQMTQMQQTDKKLLHKQTNKQPNKCNKQTQQLSYDGVYSFPQTSFF